MTSKQSLKLPNATKTVHLSRVFAAIGIIAFMIMMLAKPDFYLDSARKGLALYATSVLPSLFPFYFCSLLLTYIGAAKGVSSIFKRPVRLLYNAPKESAYVLILSMLSGYPVGASMTAELYEAGVIDEADARSIAAFASTSGPIFMLGTVGKAIFDDVRCGACILAAHYIAALINGLIYRRKKSQSYLDRHVATLSDSAHDSLMSRTISASTLNMLYVGGYIVLCGMIVDTLSVFKVDILLNNSLGTAAAPVYALLSGAIEMTRGCLACVQCAPKWLGVALAAGIISLGGLSVTLQNYTFLSKCRMSFLQIIVRKFTHAILAFVIGLLIGLSL